MDRTYKHSPRLGPQLQAQLILLLLLLCCAGGSAQTSIAAITANNTSACPSSGKLPKHCQKPQAAQADTRAGVVTPLFDSATGNVSNEDLHGYLTQGAGTRIFANLMLGFCTEGDSPYCHNNVQTGYVSNDNKTIAAQVEDMRRRHIDGAIMSWEGAETTEDAAALKLQSYLNAKHCNGPQRCDLMYLIMIDGPSVGYTVKTTGIPGTTGASCSGKTAANYEDCVVGHIRNDMCYMNGKHWGNDAYLKSNGRPVVQIFPDEGVIPAVGGAPSWTDVWIHINEWNSNLPKNCAKPPYNANNGVPLVLFENASGFSHEAAAGAYYWIKPQGTEPARDQLTYNIATASNPTSLDHFYQTAQQHPNIPTWGAAFKGFNSSHSTWGTNRIMDQQCGLVWITSLMESNKYYTESPLPFLQIATWNDYNEGTEIESGIDNCYTVSAHVDGQELKWTLDKAEAAPASLTTVSHIEIYDAQDGRNLALLATLPAAADGTYSLTNLPSLSSGKHELYVRMVGKNSILNRLSPAVGFSK